LKGGEVKMKLKVLTRSIIKASVIILPLTMVLLAGCGGEPSAPASPSTATLSEATMCKSFNPTTGPSSITDVFSQTDWIICAVKLSDAPAGTKVKTVWLYRNTQRHSEIVSAQGTKWLGSKIDNEDVGESVRFAQGDYTVKLYLNDEEQTTLPFRVE
jgi:hypothetical protein